MKRIKGTHQLLGVGLGLGAAAVLGCGETSPRTSQPAASLGTGGGAGALPAAGAPAENGGSAGSDSGNAGGGTGSDVGGAGGLAGGAAGYTCGILNAVAGAGGAGPAYDALFSPQEDPYGVPYSTWIQRFWQWLISIPATTNPINNGVCDQLQSGPVWFLAPGPALRSVTRDCTIPAASAIFVTPGMWWLRDCPEEEQCEPPGTDPIARFNELMSSTLVNRVAPVDIRVEVDGEAIADPKSYVFQSTAMYYFTGLGPDQDPLFTCTGPMLANACGYPLGDRRLANAGYAFVLQPLPPGQHTIRIRRETLDCTKWTDVIYNITIQ